MKVFSYNAATIKYDEKIGTSTNYDLQLYRIKNIYEDKTRRKCQFLQTFRRMLNKACTQAERLIQELGDGPGR